MYGIDQIVITPIYLEEESKESVMLQFLKIKKKKKKNFQDFPGGSVVKNMPANSGEKSSIPVPGRFHMPWGN